MSEPIYTGNHYRRVTLHKHTADCMSPWGERARHLMSAQTIACNHRLHLAEGFEFVCSLADCGWASDDSAAVCPAHGFRVPTDRKD